MHFFVNLIVKFLNLAKIKKINPRIVLLLHSDLNSFPYPNEHLVEEDRKIVKSTTYSLSILYYAQSVCLSACSTFSRKLQTCSIPNLAWFFDMIRESQLSILVYHRGCIVKDLLHKLCIIRAKMAQSEPKDFEIDNIA